MAHWHIGANVCHNLDLCGIAALESIRDGQHDAQALPPGFQAEKRGPVWKFAVICPVFGHNDAHHLGNTAAIIRFFAAHGNCR